MEQVVAAAQALTLPIASRLRAVMTAAARAMNVGVLVRRHGPANTLWQPQADREREFAALRFWSAVSVARLLDGDMR